MPRKKISEPPYNPIEAELVREVTAQVKYKPQDHALALLKAAVNGVPVYGSFLGSLLSDYLPSATQRAFELLAKTVEARLKQLEGRLDAEVIDKDQFVELTKSTFLVVVRSHNEERIKAAANLLSNILLKNGDNQKLPYTELDHFARALESLSNGALKLFGEVVNLDRSDGRYNVSGRALHSIASLRGTLNYPNNHLLVGLARELSGWHLLDVSVPPVRSLDDGEVSVSLTELAKQFVKAVSD
jgi:hypothetical protein